MLKQTLALVGLTLSVSANAVIVNTLGGVDYQWLELTHTQGESRDQVEARMLDAADVVYGYQYATRSQVEQLFLSYASWDGLNGYHGAAATVAGINALVEQFGATYINASPGSSIRSTVDIGDVTSSNSYKSIDAYYGTRSECAGWTCHAFVQARDGAAWIHGDYGYDPDTNSVGLTQPHLVYTSYASFLVAPAAVPVPAAGWLFMTALVGLVGKKRLARR